MKKWKKLFTANKLFLFLFLSAVLIFFYPFVLFGKVPIPGDTIVSMYHPFRDNVWSGYSAGVPYKNFLITDPVRQQYVWRTLAMEQLSRGELPLWNPYSFSGTPLLANFQSAVFYPFNLLFFFLDKNAAWGILVLLQPLILGIFLYFYLRHLNVNHLASAFGSLVFSFSGFSIVWLEWNTIGHVMVWLPLILLSIEKIISQPKVKKASFWLLIFVFSLTSSFFAGHLQVFSYGFLLSLIYLAAKILLLKKNRLKVSSLFAICYLLFVILSSVQWLPTFKFISLSARDVDQGSWQKEGWFIPWQNLTQFIAPDFFGNPATGNYWGVWNYAEFVGYIGIIPLIFAFYSLFFHRSKKSLFFGTAAISGLLMVLPTFFAKLPYVLEIPFISSSQPTRLISIVSFSLSILAALGFEKFIKDRSIRKMTALFIFVGIFFSFLWIVVLKPDFLMLPILPDQSKIAGRNLILPTFFFLTFFILTLIMTKSRKKKMSTIILYIIVVFSVLDLFRFGWKFTPFSDSSWIFPKTRILERLTSSSSVYRIMSLDRRILPPNFSVSYRLADVSGYDPLYLKSYGQLVSSWEDNRPSSKPAPFNRIITPQNYASFLADFLGVKYFLSLYPLELEKLVFLDREDSTYLYENKAVFPRAYFVEKVERTEEGFAELVKIFDLGSRLSTTAVVSEDLGIEEKSLDKRESAEIVEFSDNYIVVKTKSLVKRLLIITDVYYPSWKVLIDDKEGRIIRADYIFRGVVIPAGEHTVKFEATIL